MPNTPNSAQLDSLEHNTATLSKRVSLVPAGNGTDTTVVGVAASATVVTLKAANADRLELIIKNSSTSTGILYYKLGSAAAISSGNYTDSLAPGESVYLDSYTGIVTGIWDSATAGFANVTEVA